jgi:SHS2 domain-containing protein
MLKLWAFDRRGILVSQNDPKKYQFLEHTADAKFQAFGRSLDEAFKNAAYAMVSLMWDREKIERKIQKPVKVEGRDLEQLLVNFLEEILYFLDSQIFLLHSVEKIQIQRIAEVYVLESLFLGDDYRNHYQPYGDVKAITYNEMEIHTKNRFMVQVVVDV